ncbi:MAG: lysoplasmalogenase [Actinobacteria bacterium]|nr:lysoplasmalogenase [Actinomycetota bacterium]
MTVFVALAAADTVLAGMGRDRARWLTKPLLMPALMAGSDRASRRALAFGAAGDVALLGSGDAAFTAGLVSFLAGHLAWIAALHQRPGGGRLRSRPALALPYLAAFGSLNAYLWPRTGKDRIPVLGYSTALLAMALAALDSGPPRAAAGGALFMLSDSLLALEKFAGIQLPAHEGLVMATYASAQALLALPRDGDRVLEPATDQFSPVSAPRIRAS